MNAGELRYRVETPRATGAIAIVSVLGDSTALSGWLERARLPRVARGELKRADLFGIDDGLLAQASGSCVQLMPHGGLAILELLERALVDRGVVPGDADDDASIDACVRRALSRAASPLAIDALLRQPGLHAEWDGIETEALRAHTRVMDRLLTPTLVACAGPANVGKSTLLNALARREASLVADEPGTTRDHVGVEIDLGGLVVRWADLPGVLEPDARNEADRASWSIAERVLGEADLLVWCDDAPGPPGDRLDESSIARRPDLFVRTRTDLTGLERERHAEHALAIPPGEPPRGLDRLRRAIREALLPSEVLDADLPWILDG